MGGWGLTDGEIREGGAGGGRKGGGRGREEKEMRLWVGGGSGRRRERYINNKIHSKICIRLEGNIREGNIRF